MLSKNCKKYNGPEISGSSGMCSRGWLFSVKLKFQEVMSLPMQSPFPERIVKKPVTLCTGSKKTALVRSRSHQMLCTEFMPCGQKKISPAILCSLLNGTKLLEPPKLPVIILIDNSVMLPSKNLVKYLLLILSRMKFWMRWLKQQVKLQKESIMISL